MATNGQKIAPDEQKSVHSRRSAEPAALAISVLALRQVDDFEAHLVLLDLGLPGIDGDAVAELIRLRFGDGTPQR